MRRIILLAIHQGGYAVEVAAEMAVQHRSAAEFGAGLRLISHNHMHRICCDIPYK